MKSKTQASKHRHHCASCGGLRWDVTLAPDPYNQLMYEDSTYYWMCQPCRLTALEQLDLGTPQ